MQTKLLRVIQNREVDINRRKLTLQVNVRILAATGEAGKMFVMAASGKTCFTASMFSH